jgi:hypothetical protein
MSLYTRFLAAVQPKSTVKVGLLTPQIPVKAPNKQQSLPGFQKTTQATTARLPQNDLQTANQDIVGTYRLGNTTSQVIANLARVTPDLSAAVSAHLRIGIPEKYIAIGENPDGSFSLEATQIAMQLLTRWDRSPDYSTGFSQMSSLRSISEAIGKEGILYGAMCMELVLDKSRMPGELNPISVPQIKWYQDGTGLRPIQLVGGNEIDLDFPTVFYVALDASITDPYAQSPLESAIQPVLGGAQFLTDLRRVCARHVYPRFDVSIDEEKLRANMPPDVQADPALQPGWLNGVFAEVETMINDLGVEEAAVHWNFIVVGFVQGQSGDVPGTFDTVQKIMESKIATGAKTLPAILGHGTGNQSTASTETMLAMMTANSMVRLKLQEMYSRALTMAVRLYGIEATVSFEYDTIDLRPDSELEAFKVMKAERLLNQLSLGMITDEECTLRLTGKLPPAGYTPLMGTGFHTASAGSQGNPYSGSPQGGGQSGGGAQNQGVKSKQPQQAKGPAK